MKCVNHEHYPADRPLNFLTLDPRLHFPDEHGPACVEGGACSLCAGAGTLTGIACDRGGRGAVRRREITIMCVDCGGLGHTTKGQRAAVARLEERLARQRAHA